MPIYHGVEFPDNTSLQEAEAALAAEASNSAQQPIAPSQGSIMSRAGGFGAAALGTAGEMLSNPVAKYALGTAGGIGAYNLTKKAVGAMRGRTAAPQPPAGPSAPPPQAPPPPEPQGPPVGKGDTFLSQADIDAHPALKYHKAGDPFSRSKLDAIRVEQAKAEAKAGESRAATRAASQKSPSTVSESIPQAAPAERAMAGNAPEIPTARASQAGQRHNVPYFSESKGAKVPIEDMNQTHLLSAYKKRLAEMTELSAKGRNAPVKLAELEALKAEIKHRATLPEEMQSNVYNVPKKGDIAAQRARLAEIKAEPLPAAESRPSGRAPFMAPEGLGGAAAAIAPMALSVIPPGVIPGVNTGGMHSMAAMRAQGAALDRGFIGSQPVKASKFGGSPIGGPSPADAEWQSASPSYKRAWISSHS